MQNVKTMKNTINHKYILTLMLILYFIMFGGLYPLYDFMRGSGQSFELPILFIFFLCAVLGHDRVTIYRKWLFLFGGSLILNYMSTNYFEGRSLLTSVSSAAFVHGLFLYFPLAVIKPTIKDMENVIVTIGIYLLTLYFLQQILLPVPIVLSLLGGWRTEAGEFDIARYSIGGELFMYLFQLLCLNRFLTSKKKIYLIGIITVAVMSLLHGYRSTMFAMIIALMYTYIRVNGIKLNSKTISVIIIVFVFCQFIDQIPVVGEVLNQISEKQESQFSANSSWMDLDRVIELDFFYNQQIKSIWEWIFGCGFLSKDEYADLPQMFSWINWVDLGFIGFSFMGGILMTFCWIRLLLLNMAKFPIQYKYLSAFSVLVIFGTLTLNTAFADNATVVQAFALYLGSRNYENK